ncbi:MAG: helix-turn-helix domain-containing protein [Nocardioides sp.]
MQPIHVPEEWHDHDLLAFEQFCDLIHIPVRTVRDWRRRGVGPRWAKLEGCGRLYVTVAEVRRFLRATTNEPQMPPASRTQPERRTA